MTTFSIDSEILNEMRFQASAITDLDEIGETNIVLEPEPQSPQSLQLAGPSRETRIAHYTKLAEQGHPLFPCDDSDSE